MTSGVGEQTLFQKITNTLDQPYLKSDYLKNFIHTIKWTEPFILFLLCFHVILAYITWRTRNKTNIQNSIFFTSVITVFNVKNFNKLGSESWQKFASQNYFDENGFFIFVFVALPLLLIGNFIMSSLSIRLIDLHEKNIEQLKKLHLAIFPIKYGDHFYKELLQAAPGLVKLAYYHDFLIGSYCCRKEISDNKPKLYILTLGVLAPYRERGVGSKLLQQILELPKSSEKFNDVTEIYAHVQTSNQEALSFYQKHGFQLGEKISNYYKDLDPPDCYVVRKTVKENKTYI
eukprot:jgi/Galph1/4926/GphlegSOOS_G3575.1